VAELNETHNPRRRSWVESANDPGADFPLQNLPFGVFCRAGSEAPRCGVAIGDEILDLGAAREAGLFTGTAAIAAAAASAPTLNALMEQPGANVSALRSQIASLLCAEGQGGERLRSRALQLLVARESVQMRLPARVGGYTDFSCSYTHMAGMRNGEPARIFFQFPMGYHGRTSSLRPSRFPVTRPRGQSGGADAASADVQFGPEPRLDFELEFAAFIRQGNELGVPLSVDEAADRLFGYCLLNDWSARGIQMLEMGGLGPFLGKSFITTISPWVVTQEALAPFRVARPQRRNTEPPVPAHLDSCGDSQAGGMSVELTAHLQTAGMRAGGLPAARIVATNLRHLYWTFAQMLAHQTSNGCNAQAGDLIASGTVSGPEPEGRACLAEINQRGRKPLELPGGYRRLWLEDGDELTIRGRAVREGYVSIGFGECTGQVYPSAGLSW
jgi:fumarylacetoacetase